MTNQHPSLRQVDFIGFSARAERLWGGGAMDSDLLNTLYPVGYPALLGLGQRLCGDALWAGKGLAALFGAWLIGAAARWLGVGAALWLLATPMVLEFGAVEGTDMPAAALSLAALSVAARRPALAGALLGAACLCRYTALAALPAALWLSPARGRLLLSFVVATAPHWGVALWQGRSPLPDQSINMAIGAGGPGEAPSRAEAFVRALRGAWEPWTAKLGGLGLLVGLWRRDRRAVALSLWGLAHVAGISLAFSTPRLALPASLCAAAGLCFVLRGPALWAAAFGLFAWSAPRLATLSPQEEQLAPLQDLTEGLDGPFASSTPWFTARRDGWLVESLPLRALERDPRQLTPARLVQRARERGLKHIVLEPGRVTASNPGLRPLLSGAPVEGLRLVVRKRGWVIFAVEPVTGTATPRPPPG
ncbi:hypothetical protein L6R49_12625 [Myxococcota bacterium]|nr:hypothetical protein [Myxococcota bacterium]